MLNHIGNYSFKCVSEIKEGHTVKSLIFFFLNKLVIYVFNFLYKFWLQEKDKYGNEVSRLARPLPVEYLLVDVPTSTPLSPQFTFPVNFSATSFPIENR